MNRLVVACALAACGTPTSPAPEPAPVRMPVEDPAATVSLAARIEPPPRPLYEAVRALEPPPAHVITAAPSGTMAAIALTEDGTTAVTVDAAGAMRLWPTLDGTREPVVIRARQAIQLAIGREGDEVVIAGLDLVGQLELVRASALGLETERIAIDAPRPIVAMRVVGSRVLAVRDDQVIAAFDTHGRLLGEVEPGPGERVAALEATHGRALAIVHGGATVRGRWLDLGTALSWGASTPPLALDPERAVALAPDGARLAAVTPSGRKIVILELATGKHVATAASLNAEESVGLAPIGFLDDNVLAETWQARMMLWKDDTVTELDPGGRARAAAGGRLVADSRGTLLVARESGTKYLGYATPELAQVVARRDGLVATDRATVVRVDRTLHADRVFELPPDVLAPSWRQLTLLDDHYALAYGDKGGHIVDLDSVAMPVPMPIDGTVTDYRRDTHVIAMRTPDAIKFARFDPATGTFTATLDLPLETSYGTLVMLLDPANAVGAVGAVAHSLDGERKVDVREVRLEAGRVVLGRSRIVLVDRTFWEDEAQLRRLVHDVSRTRVTSPDGALVAELDAGVLTLRTRAGVEKWSRRITGDAVVWTARGELVLWGNGLARLDLDTGVFADLQCGWRFGLYDEPMNAPAFPGVCDLHE